MSLHESLLPLPSFMPKRKEYLPEIMLLHDLISKMDRTEFRLRWAARFRTAKIETLSSKELYLHTGIRFELEQHPPIVVAVPNLEDNANEAKLPAIGIPAESYQESIARYVLFMTYVLDAERNL